jgi:hypothetical protein
MFYEDRKIDYHRYAKDHGSLQAFSAEALCRPVQPTTGSHLYQSAVIAPVSCTISRETLSAQVEIPELHRQVNLMTKEWQSFFRIHAVLGVLPDFFYQNEHVGYVPTIPKETIAPVQQFTPWMSCWSRSPATLLEMKLPALPVQEGFALMVSVGLCFGQPLSADGRDVLELRTGGAAKILRVM